MKLESLRELIVLFDTQMQQLTVANLVTGFFPLHSLVSSLATTIVCAALAVTFQTSRATTPMLFTSFSSFAAICVTAVMATALLFRVAGGRFSYSARATADVVDWMLDAVSRPLAEDTARMLLAPEKRRQRGCFFAGLFLIAEVGKVLPFWWMCTLLSAAWVGWSVYRTWHHRVEA